MRTQIKNKIMINSTYCAISINSDITGHRPCQISEISCESQVMKGLSELVPDVTKKPKKSNFLQHHYLECWEFIDIIRTMLNKLYVYGIVLVLVWSITG